ncbi:MAG: D-alanyl-D-alanine carboxypeptidase [Ruminococcus flavefaciens]|jgi:D-alanyl-D-alanine carboxypeptidase (penicillin-binding protein 5/6)|nr:D-alanyl-D-alanine carboxypeptidase [Ruminococcus flavefaciens]
MEQKKLISPIISRSAALYCIEDKKYLYADNINVRIYPASITKLLTACTALQFLSLDSIITVGDEYELINEHSSLALVFPGYRLTFSDLLAGMLISSGCDAAYTVAAAAARAAFPDKAMSAQEAVERFVSMMNEYAASVIGMVNSRFQNPDGQDEDEHYSTAEDLIKLGRHALGIPEIKAVTKLTEKESDIVSGEHLVWLTTNKLLVEDSPYYCPEAVGLKTGSTDLSGFLLLGAFEQWSKTYISFVSCPGPYGEQFSLTLQLLSECGLTARYTS